MDLQVKQMEYNIYTYKQIFNRVLFKTGNFNIRSISNI